MIKKEESTKILNFMTPGAGVLALGHGPYRHLAQPTFCSIYILVDAQALIRQTMYIVMITKEGSTKIVNFMTPGAGVLVLGCGHISHIVKMHNFVKNLLLYSQA